MASYDAQVIEFGATPVVSYAAGSSSFAQAFNPSWVQASVSTGGKAGLLVRAQNCAAAPPGKCIACSGTGRRASVIAFAELLTTDDNSSSSSPPPRFATLDKSSVVLAPHDATDNLGVEDPRISRDPATGIYHMFYTCYNSGRAKPQPAVALCLASTRNPTTAAAGVWTRHGWVGLGPGSKSAAILFSSQRRRQEDAGMRVDDDEHLLFWGAGEMRLSRSRDLRSWTRGAPFLTNTTWGNPHVEAGPPPLRLSSGDFVLFHNSWNAAFPESPGYQPSWAILRGDDPSQIVARASRPLWSPSKAHWMAGTAPALCNVPNVAFLEAAHATDEPDTFRVYFGGADTVVGTAIVRITITTP